MLNAFPLDNCGIWVYLEFVSNLRIFCINCFQDNFELLLIDSINDHVIAPCDVLLIKASDNS